MITISVLSYILKYKGPRKSSANPPRINYMKEVLQQSCEILFKDLIN